MEPTDIKAFLDDRADQYNRRHFIEEDPIQIPHLFSDAGDIEMAAFLTATLSWGRRSMIISKARELMDRLFFQPFEFLKEASEQDLMHASKFQYRTFQETDLLYFLRSLQSIIQHYGSLGKLFESIYQETGNIYLSLVRFREIFLSLDGPLRTHKHVSAVENGAAGKRLNMFLRWMVRDDNRGVDFGLWKTIPASELWIPLDVHTATVSRKLGLLFRRQNDWKAVEELTSKLRVFDPADPVKYDFALFGLGVIEKF